MNGRKVSATVQRTEEKRENSEKMVVSINSQKDYE